MVLAFMLISVLLVKVHFRSRDLTPVALHASRAIGKKVRALFTDAAYATRTPFYFSALIRSNTSAIAFRAVYQYMRKFSDARSVLEKGRLPVRRAARKITERICLSQLAGYW
jgi:hypothetical protein